MAARWTSAKAVARATCSAKAFRRLDRPIMGAEDFCLCAGKGAGRDVLPRRQPQGADWQACCGIHSTRMMVDEAVMPRGAALLAGWRTVPGARLELRATAPLALPPATEPALAVDVRENGAPDRIRTCGLCLRRAALYPAELRVRGRAG
jgi:hypothetical protein